MKPVYRMKHEPDDSWTVTLPDGTNITGFDEPRHAGIWVLEYLSRKERRAEYRADRVEETRLAIGAIILDSENPTKQ